MILARDVESLDVMRGLRDFVMAVCIGGGALAGLCLGFPSAVEARPGDGFFDPLFAGLWPVMRPAMIGLWAGSVVAFTLCLLVPGIRSAPRGKRQR